MTQTDNAPQKKSPLVPIIVLGGIVVGSIAMLVTGNGELLKQILMAVGLVLLGITILVTIHELGHFLTAKAFGMRVNAFSIGFPPTIFSYTKGDTEYRLGATPLGGFVHIEGIIDEAMDTTHIDKEPEPYEFRAKPIWQRLIVMTGGVIMNVILGVVLFSLLLFFYGEIRTPAAELDNGIIVHENMLGYHIGLRTGDELISVNEEEQQYVEDYLDTKNLMDAGGTYEVMRNGEKISLEVPPGMLNLMSEDSIAKTLFLLDTKPAKIGAIAGGSPAEEAGIQKGDIITRLDSTPLTSFGSIRNVTQARPNLQLQVYVERDGKQLEPMTLTTDSSGMIGLAPDYSGLAQDTISYGFFRSFGPGTAMAFSILSVNVKGLGKVATGEVNASKSVMGPIQIAKVYLNAFTAGGWRAFLRLTGMLSMILAFMNILPIPALDGGHVVFLLIEAVTGKEPSPKIRIVAQQIGMVILLGLMVLIFFNDILRVI